VIDHLVLGVPDLEQGAASFAERTGLRPVFGGRHATGTANYLVGLGGGAYLEIIGILPEERDNGQSQPFGLEALEKERLVTWCLRTGDIDAAVAQARERGVELGGILSLDRSTPSGELVSWRMTRRTPMAEEGTLPFLIDWGTTPHPSTRSLPPAELVRFEVRHPEPRRMEASLAAMSCHATVIGSSRPQLRAIIRTPAGLVSL
jgi:hypothetical protein